MSNPHSKLFEEIATVFNKHGFKLYMVGGTSRDFLLKSEITDFDFATDATPSEMKVFLPDANYRYSEFGTVSFKKDGKLIEVTTLRQEGRYFDFRHPGDITFARAAFEKIITIMLSVKVHIIVSLLAVSTWLLVNGYISGGEWTTVNTTVISIVIGLRETFKMTAINYKRTAKTNTEKFKQ